MGNRMPLFPITTDAARGVNGCVFNTLLDKIGIQHHIVYYIQEIRMLYTDSCIHSALVGNLTGRNSSWIFRMAHCDLVQSFFLYRLVDYRKQ